ncbi:MAG TPA: hypothetical protein VGI67_07035 [Thermoleophilaceae bacterium]
MPATWVPLAAIAVHQARFFLAYGAQGRHELAETGHSYLSSLTPWIVLLCALGVGSFLRGLALAWRDGEPERRRDLSTLRLWLVASAALILIYAGQEALEGLLSTGHPDGLAGIFGDGGLWAVPAALVVGAALALLVRGGEAAITFVARLARRPSRGRRARLAVRPPAPVFIVHASPLARCAPGRAPPLRV